MRKTLFFIVAVLFCVNVWAQELELTVYNQNFALVKDQRYFSFKKGLNKIDFRDVASSIEPTSVHFTSLTAPDSCVILEQNYEYDLVSSDKLLSKYIDMDIKLVTEDDRTHQGKLLSFDNNNLVIASAEGLKMVARDDNIRQILLEKLPEGLITKPTLVWEVDSKIDGKHLTEVSYLTQNVNWHCEYVVVLGKDDQNLDLDSWVSINNRSGATYKDAKLKLIAGEVKRAQEKRLRADLAYEVSAKGAPQFEEEAFFEYHMYTLGRKATLKDNQTKQISLLNARGISVDKEFIFDPSRGRWSYNYYSDQEAIKENVRVELEFKNSKKNNLGMPLPEGKIKVYKEDKEGSLQFIGEDAIGHTPKDEDIRLYIGDAFDIIGERTRTNFSEAHKTMQETYEIVLRNHKDEAVNIKVSEKVWRYSNWQIVKTSDRWDKKDASTIEFKVRVPKDSEKKITYTVKYWW